MLPAPIASARASALAPCQWLCHSGSWRCYLRLLRWHCGSCQWHLSSLASLGPRPSRFRVKLCTGSSQRDTLRADSQSALLAPRSCQPECERERHRALQVRSVLGPARPPGSAATGCRRSRRPPISPPLAGHGYWRQSGAEACLGSRISSFPRDAGCHGPADWAARSLPRGPSRSLGLGAPLPLGLRLSRTGHIP